MAYDILATPWTDELTLSPYLHLALVEGSSPATYASRLCFPGLSCRRVAHLQVFSKLEL